jgi:pimeloyl-ACP methyl ester carboxylesterase
MMKKQLALLPQFFAISFLVAVILFVPWDGRAQGPDSHEPGGGEEKSVDSSSAEPSQEFVLKPWRALRSHLHNKIIHVPVGFSLSAFFLSLLALKKPELQPAIRWLVLIAALASLAALITGSNQAAAYEGGSKEWVVQLHRELGIAAAVSLWIWCAVHWLRSFREWAFSAGVLAVLVLIAAGFFGGVIAH